MFNINCQRFTKINLMAALAVSLLAFTIPSANAERVITDQLGNQVTLPNDVKRAVVLFHQALDVIVQVDAQSQVVGVLRDWPKRLGQGFKRLAPSLVGLPEPGDLTTVNIEQLLALEPDVVFLTHFAPDAVKDQIKASGIPIVQLSFFSVPESERGKRNPVLANEQQAYTDGLIEAVTIVGEVFGKQDAAKELVTAITRTRNIVEERTSQLPDDKRPRLYMAEADLNTYGTGKYSNVMMHVSGGLNVAREMNGYGKVTMEQVIGWDPEVVIVQDRYIEVADQLRNDPAWAPVTAIKAGQILITPEYVKPGGHPLPESVALGEFWMSKMLHPELFKDIDLDAEVQSYYKKFYRVDYVAK